jgi:UDP-N-acetylglucosamine 2-epimerase (non-hydrolysing)
MKRVIHVVGARPNFMKLAPVVQAMHGAVEQIVVHTGQHYDRNMSDVFFGELGMPEPDVNLAVGPGTHAKQTAEIMSRFEDVVVERRPDLVMVYGDVNSTAAAALVCAKLGVMVAHVEAGLRSWDRTMPEEINRLVTDQLSDLLFTHSPEADNNLLREGIRADAIHLVGNVMIDTLVRCLSMARAPVGIALPERFGLVTLHRPSNVDDPKELRDLVALLSKLGRSIPIVFPLHPRTKNQLEAAGLLAEMGPDVHLIDPQGYLEFLYLEKRAALVVTDSGGVQEETTFLRVPCITVRENTERPVTVSIGSNTLVGRDVEHVEAAAMDVLAGKAKHGDVPPLWDGRAAERIAVVVRKTLS